MSRRRRAGGVEVFRETTVDAIRRDGASTRCWRGSSEAKQALDHGPRRRPSFRGPPRRRLDGDSRGGSRRRPLADRRSPPRPSFRGPPRRRSAAILEALRSRRPPRDDVEPVQERRDAPTAAPRPRSPRGQRANRLCGNQPVCRVRRRAGVASMAWRTTRRFRTNAP